MNQYDYNYPRTADQVVIIQNNLIRQVYAWMGLGLALTAIMALTSYSIWQVWFQASMAAGVTVSVVTASSKGSVCMVCQAAQIKLISPEYKARASRPVAWT